jgi:hypothetical protein
MVELSAPEDVSACNDGVAMRYNVSTGFWGAQAGQIDRIFVIHNDNYQTLLIQGTIRPGATSEDVTELEEIIQSTQIADPAS